MADRRLCRWRAVLQLVVERVVSIAYVRVCVVEEGGEGEVGW